MGGDSYALIGFIGIHQKALLICMKSKSWFLRPCKIFEIVLVDQEDLPNRGSLFKIGVTQIFEPHNCVHYYFLDISYAEMGFVYILVFTCISVAALVGLEAVHM